LASEEQNTKQSFIFCPSEAKRVEYSAACSVSIGAKRPIDTSRLCCEEYSFFKKCDITKRASLKTKNKMAYSEKVVDHYNNPRNVGSFPKDTPGLGTGLVGAPECGDVMKLQIRVAEKEEVCQECGGTGARVEESAAIDMSYEGSPGTNPCSICGGQGKIRREVIEDAKFKTFGCGSAIASSSLATEWIKGLTPDEAEKVKNTQIVEELSLPPVKIHCSVLAEDAIKAAIADYKRKKAERAKLGQAKKDEQAD
jgi:nitrogen fixation NifU-like protein